MSTQTEYLGPKLSELAGGSEGSGASESGLHYKKSTINDRILPLTTWD